MWSKVLILFDKIKTREYWNDKWQQKTILNNRDIMVSTIKRKFRDDEVKEICMDSKNNIISIREYRYDEKGLLYKLVVKAWDGSIKCINDVKYKDENIYAVEMKYIEEEKGIIRRLCIFLDGIRDCGIEAEMQDCIEYISTSLKERSNKNYIENIEEIYYESNNKLVVEKISIPIVEDENTGISIEDKLYYNYKLVY